jgi:hypothetical protein
MRTRDEPTYPLVGLLAVLIVGGGFWVGVVLIAARFL